MTFWKVDSAMVLGILFGLVLGFGGIAAMRSSAEFVVERAEAAEVQRVFQRPWVLPKALIARWKLVPAKEGGIPLLGEDGQVYALDDWARAVNRDLLDHERQIEAQK